MMEGGDYEKSFHFVQKKKRKGTSIEPQINRNNRRTLPQPISKDPNQISNINQNRTHSHPPPDQSKSIKILQPSLLQTSNSNSSFPNYPYNPPSNPL